MRARLLSASMLALVAAPAAAEPQRYVQPYIELSQAAAADLTNGGDVLTYTQAAVGVDAGIKIGRAHV